MRTSESTEQPYLLPFLQWKAELSQAVRRQPPASWDDTGWDSYAWEPRANHPLQVRRAGVANIARRLIAVERAKFFRRPATGPRRQDLKRARTSRDAAKA